MSVGRELGELEGMLVVGDPVGKLEGLALGARVGTELGFSVGSRGITLIAVYCKNESSSPYLSFKVTPSFESRKSVNSEIKLTIFSLPFRGNIEVTTRTTQFWTKVETSQLSSGSILMLTSAFKKT